MQDVRSDDGRVTRASSSAAAAAKQKAKAKAESKAAAAAEEAESGVSSEGSDEYNPEADKAAKVRLNVCYPVPKLIITPTLSAVLAARHTTQMMGPSPMGPIMPAVRSASVGRARLPKSLLVSSPRPHLASRPRGRNPHQLSPRLRPRNVPDQSLPQAKMPHANTA